VVEIRGIEFFQKTNDDERLLRFQQLGSGRVGPLRPPIFRVRAEVGQSKKLPRSFADPSSNRLGFVGPVLSSFEIAALAFSGRAKGAPQR
jgi:hypothetical protein